MLKKKEITLFITLLCLTILFQGLNVTAQAEPQRGGTLRVTINSDPPSLDMHLEGGQDAQEVGYHIFETVLAMDERGGPSPMLAEYEFLDNGKKIVLKLRDNVKFHNGDLMDAEDVIASINRWLKCSSFGRRTIGELLESIEAPDSHTVVLSLNDVSPLALTALAYFDEGPYVMPKEVIEAAGEDKIKEYIGTGPYKLVEWKRDRHIKLARFEDYAALPGESKGFAGRKHAWVDEILFIPTGDKMAEIMSLRTGDYDIVMGVPSHMFDELDSDPNLKGTVVKRGIMPAMVFNMKEGILTNHKIRQAILYILDMEEIMIAAEGDPRFFELHPCWMPSGSSWWNNSGGDIYNRPDPEKAKQLLGEAGYNGEKIIWITTKDIDYFYKTAMVASTQMGKIGLNVDVQVIDNATLRELRNIPDAYNIFSAGLTQKPDPTLIAFMKNGWAGWYDTGEKHRLVEKLVAEVDQEKRQELWEEMSSILYQQVPVITFGERKTGVVMRDRLNNFWTGSEAYYWNVWLSD